MLITLSTQKSGTIYSKLGNFHENFIFMNSIQRYTCICHVKNSLLGHDLQVYISKRQNDFAIAGGFYFHQSSHP